MRRHVSRKSLPPAEGQMDSGIAAVDVRLLWLSTMHRRFRRHSKVTDTAWYVALQAVHDG